MTDIQHLLTSAADSVEAPTTGDARADLARGQRALRRRTARRLALRTGVGGALAAAALAAGPFASSNGTHGPATADSSSPSAIATGATPDAKKLELVAYEGPNPHGFELELIPDGWKITNSGESTFVIAPEDYVDPVPTEGVIDMHGLSVVLAKDVPSPLVGRHVTVNGRPGIVFVTSDNDGTRTLFVRQPSGLHLAVQLNGGLGLDEADLVAIANGITITPDAVGSAG